MKFLAKLSNLF